VLPTSQHYQNASPTGRLNLRALYAARTGSGAARPRRVRSTRREHRLTVVDHERLAGAIADTGSSRASSISPLSSRDDLCARRRRAMPHLNLNARANHWRIDEPVSHRADDAAAEQLSFGPMITATIAGRIATTNIGS